MIEMAGVVFGGLCGLALGAAMVTSRWWNGWWDRHDNQ